MVQKFSGPDGDVDGGCMSSEVEVVRSALRQAAKTLDQNLRSFSGQGTPGDLQSRGVVSAQHLGDWDAGQALAASTSLANRNISLGYEKFLREYQAAIAALLRVASLYHDAEEMTAERVRSLIADARER
ncbi:hypothetical protein OHR68_36065 [Spirillospora sp. NBC_00431]